MIIIAKEKHCFEIATLHQQTITQGFLIRLGVGFLKNLYGFLIKNELILVYKENKQILGFVSCALSSAGIMKQFMLACPGGILQILLALVKNPGLLKPLWETFHAPSLSATNTEVKVEIPKTELLSISVNPEVQQRGIGTKLLNGLEEELKKRGIKRYKVIAGEKLEGANKFYKKNDFVLAKQITIHGEDISNVYIKALK